MLVVFAANFLIFCHCAARAEGRHHSCCEKMECGAASARGKAPKHSGCQGMQAVRFNLVEKQVASSIAPGEIPVILLTFAPVVVPVAPVKEGFRHGGWRAYPYAPPDLQVLYQRFLI